MPKMHLEKSISIQATPEHVFEIVRHFSHWTKWSPWLILESDAEVRVSESGKHYTWNGKRVGSGEMTILSEEANNRVDYDLTFLKPWKSKAKVWFTTQSKDGGTEVTWGMESSLPFFLFFMTKMMTTMIGMDYERGLGMLKDYAETGSVPSDLKTSGPEQYPETLYAGVKTSCLLEEMGPKMEEDFKRLGAWRNEPGVELAGPPFSLYTKWDMANGKAEYIAAFPLRKIPDNLPDSFVSGKIPATSVYTVTHTGPYRHLGNAWSLGYTMIRNKEFKSCKKVHPFEVYLTSPHETPENDMVTKVYFPAR